MQRRRSVTWLRGSCETGKTCPRVGREGRRVLVQGYPVTDPELLAEVPAGEVLVWVPEELLPEVM